MSNSIDKLAGTRLAGSRGGVLKTVLVVLIVLGAGAFWFLQNYPLDETAYYADELENFKYGTIGADTDNGMPVRVLAVLPEMFPEHLPAGAPRDYTAFGFVQEPGHAMPVGFSTRTRIVPLAGMNCAACHVGYIRLSPEADPTVIVTMGSNTADLGAFFQFLFDVTGDQRFTADAVIAAMDQREPLGLVDKLVYRYVIGQFRDAVQKRQRELAQLFVADRAPFGPGRVDTFNPYKLTQLREHWPDGLSPEESIGTARLASIWNQKIKRDVQLNWDGNAPRIQDRNVGAAFGAGATPESVDIALLDRVDAWIVNVPPPEYPFDRTADQATYERGAALWQEYCYECHAKGGKLNGKVLKLAAVKTSPYRLNSYTEKLNDLFNTMGGDAPWALREMTKTDGYACRTLDGIWARAPYLHNGSVPTLWDLLTPEDQRNGGKDHFYVGHAVFDPERVGLRTDIEELDGRKMFRFDLKLAGNGNEGHSGKAYGTELPDEDKRALIEYLKTL